MASRNARMHGRVEGAQGSCAVPGCPHAGEFRAPVQPANFDGPGIYRLMCLDHVREHNASYNYFDGMSPDEIADAQSPIGAWDRATRAFATRGGDPPPAWTDFADPLDAIATRFRRNGRQSQQSSSRFTQQEQRALSVLGLGEDSDQAAVRTRYRQLLRRYHPDRNRGDRSHEKRLGDVIEAYQTLKNSNALG